MENPVIPTAIWFLVVVHLQTGTATMIEQFYTSYDECEARAYKMDKDNNDKEMHLCIKYKVTENNK